MSEPDDDKPNPWKKAGEVIGVVGPCLSYAATLTTQAQQFDGLVVVGGVVAGVALTVLSIIAIKKGRHLIAISALVVLLLAPTFFLGRLTAPAGDVAQNTTAELNATMISYSPKGSDEIIPFDPAAKEVSTSATPLLAPDVVINGRLANYRGHEDDDLWILVAPENSDDYAIQHGKCVADAAGVRFYCSNVRVGSGKNLRWQILVVRTTKERSQEWLEMLRQNRDQLDGLPADVIRLDAKAVIR